ncbi:nucleotide kinase domain-containing protein [Hymenobacter actinosclerus]|uniref:5-hmdU DNA kinase helical domain-containing protein n=1 Tax=Hymenobacter actinosclerus TaxID=82805 RepID=A0A1I0J9P8_9BACT|nr:nucleotide kinase domain-containing protein [Hymenobacter actinosclerus]SEU06668.1 hypothetical protein SAMN04487998_3739 [Hymenobacter actinosclerus]
MNLSTYNESQYLLFDSKTLEYSRHRASRPLQNTLCVDGKLLTTSPVYDSYWYLACERQNIFFNRLKGQPVPWTNDPILLKHKFTNAYRAADRTSQYLIRNVIYREDLPSTPKEVVFRILLFKIFNKIETWKYLEEAFGSITYSEYNFDEYDSILSQLLKEAKQIYSAAYMMPPGGRQFGYIRKHQNHLRLIEKMMAESLPEKLNESKSMANAFSLLKSYPTIGDFLAYQYATDINYSEVTNFDENEFVIAGPGAKDGIEKCFVDTKKIDYSTIIRAVMENQSIEFEKRNLNFQPMWSRSLQLIDCQNMFCEVGKYARARHPDIAGISGRTRIKQLFSVNPNPMSYFFPPKWGITTV